MALTMIVIGILVAVFGYRLYAVRVDRNIFKLIPSGQHRPRCTTTG
jgi:hypothetical protein